MNIKRIDKSAPVQSCFLPGTNIQFAWDSTSLGLLKQCPRLYQYTMIDGWTGRDENIHLYFGQEYHQALQEYDIARNNDHTHDDALRVTIRDLMTRIKEWNPDPLHKAAKYKNRHTLIRAVIWYLEHYRDDKAKTFILDDGTPAVELSFRFELDFGPNASQEDEAIVRAREQGNFGEVSHIGQPYLLSGHLDRVVEFQGDLYDMDHKTTTTTPSDYYFNQFEPNNQMTLYTFAGRVILKSPIKGVIINACQLMVGACRFVRGFTQRTEKQLEEWLGDLKYYFALAEQYAINNYWPMNDTACDKFGGCKFRGICSRDPRVREQFLKASFVKQKPEDRWNPLRSR